MYCCDTNKLEAVLLGKMKLMHVPDLACTDASRLSRLIKLLKAAFHGSGRIHLTLNGGHIAAIKLGEATFDEEV